MAPISNSRGKVPSFAQRFHVVRKNPESGNCPIGRLSIDAKQFEGCVTDLTAVVEEPANVLPAKAEEIQKWVLSVAAADLEGPGGFSLSKRLQLIRDALRVPLPEPTFARDEPQALQVDTLLAVDETGFSIEGWTRDEDETFDRLTVVSPEGQEARLADAFRLRRSDVEEMYGSSVRHYP